MNEMKVKEYGWQTSYTYTKQNNETSCTCFKWGREGVKSGRDGGCDVTYSELSQ
jgi:hypothetical protein